MHLKDSISTDILKRLMHPARPMNFDRRSNCLPPQTEMNSFVTGRKIAAGCRHCRHLGALRGYQLHLRPDPIPVASVPVAGQVRYGGQTRLVLISPGQTGQTRPGGRPDRG